MSFNKSLGKYFCILSLFFMFFSSNVFACACGCGIFGVGTSALMPSCQGGTAFLEYDHLNQNQNWSGTDKSSADNNDDKRIHTEFVTAGVQYMFNKKWGMNVKLPYVKRDISMQDEDSEEVNIMKHNVAGIGDVKISGIYSGFSKDMSTGITFGLKLPTGGHKHDGLERDTQIGTGSTDVLLGFYHMEKIHAQLKNLGWFMQGSLQHAVITKNNYRQGDEFSGSLGAYYDLGSFYKISKIAPILQITASRRMHDSQAAANPANTGYTQMFFAPGLELNFGSFKTYFDTEFQIYRNVNGNQLVATRIYKIILGYSF